MKKIMFSDKFGLTQAVLEGRKTMTRQIITCPKEFKGEWVAGFKAEFHKSHTHDAEQVYYFYYCVPENIYDKAIEFLRHCKLCDCNADYPAVLYYTETGQIVNTGFGNKYSKGKHRKLFIEEILQVATAAMQGMRFRG